MSAKLSIPLGTKVGIVGLGYWGSIVRRVVGKENVHMTYDVKYDPTERYEKLLVDCTHVIVASPATTHVSIVNDAIKHGCHVFCEKPLGVHSYIAEQAFDLALKRGTKLHVDWVFRYNEQVKKIVELDWSLRRADMLRLNNGPARQDVDAKHDLMCHDLSIIHALMEPERFVGMQIEKTQNVEHTASCRMYDGISDVRMHASWNFPAKVRTCVFTFDEGIVVWDDSTGILRVNGDDVRCDGNPPLTNSLESFFNHDTTRASYDVTASVLRTLERVK